EAKSLMKLNGGRLKILYADMLDYHCIVDALNGCCGLFYTFDPPQYDEVMAEVEVRVFYNVLEDSAHTETRQNVVFTSSMATVAWSDDRNSVADLHERHWRNVNLCRRLKFRMELQKMGGVYDQSSTYTDILLFRKNNYNLLLEEKSLTIGNMPSWWRKSSSKEVKKKGSRDNIFDGPRVDSRSPSPSNSISHCHSFAERPHGKPLPLPSTLPSALGRIESAISFPVPLGNVSWRSSPCLPLPSPGQASNMLDSADVDGYSTSSSVSSVTFVDSVEAADLQLKQ
ncbi:hypothetical protein KI387_024968, partial [Taxus chinensis]